MISSPDQPTQAPLTPEEQFDQDVATVLATALAHHHAGELDDAEALYRAILDAKPEHADVCYNLGVLLIQTSRTADAILCFETALGVNPHQGQYWVSYVDALQRTGETAAAWLALEMGQQRGLKGPAVDGLIERLSNPQAVAAALAAQAAVSSATPTAPVVETIGSTTPGEACAPSADRQNDTGSRGKKEKATRTGNAPTPQDINQFASLYNKGRLPEATEFARALTLRYPDAGMSWRAYGLTLYVQGQYVDAFAPLQKAVAQLPDDIEARTLLANVLNVKGMYDEAMAVCDRIIEIEPRHAEAHRVRGTTLTALGRLGDSIESCRRAVEFGPHLATMHGGLGTALLEDGRVTEAEESFRRALELDPLDIVSHSNLLFCLTHRMDVDAATLLAQHKTFGERHEDPVRAQWPTHPNAREPGRKLKIGFVSGDLFNHVVTFYVEPLLKELALDSSLSLYVYYNYVREDSITERLRGRVPNWLATFGLNEDALAERIRADGIDILIDLSGHTGRNRLRTFARKPAPIQASWIGYPGTTGLHATDYYLADHQMLPPGWFEDRFVEKIVRLPANAAFMPPPNVPPVNMLPALHNGFVTFGSFNRLNKLRPEVIALWAELMHKCRTRAWCSARFPSRGGEPMLIDWFAQHGIGTERLTFRPRSNMAVYMQQHHQVDICLDAFPYAGFDHHAEWPVDGRTDANDAVATT